MLIQPYTLGADECISDLPDRTRRRHETGRLIAAPNGADADDSVAVIRQALLPAGLGAGGR